jgi:methylated-DNA-[protein]-cysteine S-methyltransferase
MNRRYPLGQLWVGETLDTPIGPVSLAASDRGVVEVAFADSAYFIERFTGMFRVIARTPNPDLEYATRQLSEYFSGQRKAFDFPLDWRIFTPFENQVLEAAHQIPFGELRTYGQLAADVGTPQAPRSIGGVMGRNPFLIVVPCHRVISARRRLQGYSAPGGLETKAWLLRHEGHQVEGNRLIKNP